MKLTRFARAIKALEFRRRTARMESNLRRFEAYAERLIGFYVWLATDPKAKATGARAALLGPALAIEKEVEACIAIIKAALTALRNPETTGSEICRGFAKLEHQRCRLSMACLAFRDCQMDWRLRAEQWRPHWPVDVHGALVPLPEPGGDDHTPEWMSPNRREQFWEVRRSLGDLEELRREYVGIVQEITSDIRANQTESRKLAADVSTFICGMRPLFEAVFKMLFELRNADVPDDEWPHRLPRGFLRLVERFSRESEAIGRRVDSWRTRRAAAK